MGRAGSSDLGWLSEVLPPPATSSRRNPSDTGDVQASEVQDPLLGPEQLCGSVRPHEWCQVTSTVPQSSVSPPPPASSVLGADDVLRRHPESGLLSPGVEHHSQDIAEGLGSVTT